MRKKILLLYYGQFGYHTDLFMYGKYLDKREYEVHYLCFDQGLAKVELENVFVNYVSITSNKVWNYLNYFYQFKKYVNYEKFHLIFHLDSEFAFLIRMLSPFQHMVLDIRTGDLSENNLKLWFKNFQILFVSYFYKNVSIISESLRKRLHIKRNKTTIIPLGGEYLNIPPKTFNTIRLLYVGSLNSRNIHETIFGLAEYLNQDDAFQNISYDIIGFGKESTIQQLLDAIEKTGLKEKVFFHGQKRLDELFPFYEKCNVGIVYIPQKKVYDCQPTTKLFESLLAGMPVIATNTFENRNTLDSNCGIIIEDNVKDFSKALEDLIKIRTHFDSQKIKEVYLAYTWDDIVKSKLEPYLNNAISK